MSNNFLDQDNKEAELFLSSCPEYHNYVATIAPFDKEAKRVGGMEYPLSDPDYYRVTAKKIQAMQKLVIRLMNEPSVNDNYALVSMCRSLKYEIQHQVNEATA